MKIIGKLPQHRWKVPEAMIKFCIYRCDFNHPKILKQNNFHAYMLKQVFACFSVSMVGGCLCLVGWIFCLMINLRITLDSGICFHSTDKHLFWRYTCSLGILPPGLLCNLSFPFYLQLECNAGAKREGGEFQLVSKLHDNIHLTPVQGNSHNNIHNKNSQEGGYKDHVYQTSGCLQCSNQVQAHSPSLVIMY